MLGKILRGFAYFIYFLVALIGFLYLSIPTEKVKSYLEAKATVALKTNVKIGGLKIHGLTGVTLSNVKIELVPKEAPPGPEGAEVEPTHGAGGPRGVATPAKKKEPNADAKKARDDASDAPIQVKSKKGLIMASELRLDLNTWGLLRGRKLKASLKADVSGGTIRGATYERTDTGWKVAVDDLKDINLVPMRLFEVLFGKRIHMSLSGKEIEIDWHGSWQNSTANFELSLADTVIGHYEIKDPVHGWPVGEAFDVDLGKIDIVAKLGAAKDLGVPGGDRHVLVIERLRGLGKHVDIQIDGGQRHTITFHGPKFTDGIINLKLVASLKEALFAWKGDGRRDDGSVVKGVSHEVIKYGLCAREDGKLCLDQLRQARVRRGGRDYFGFHCTGPLKALKCKPVRPSLRVTPSFGKGQPVADEKDPDANKGGAASPRKFERPKPPSSAHSNRPTAREHKSKRPRTTSRPAGRLVEPGRSNPTPPPRPRISKGPGVGDAPADEVDPGEPGEPEIRGGRTPTVGEPAGEDGDEDGDDEGIDGEGDEDGGDPESDAEDDAADDEEDEGDEDED